MINRTQLLADLQKLLQRLEADLLERSGSAEVPEVGKTLRAEYDRAKTAERTAQNYDDWRTDAITQAAAAWVLSCVFARFSEDNRLIDPPKIAGPAERLARARDEHELYFRDHPKLTDREYLLAVFDQLARLPGTKNIFGEHNPIRELPNWLSGDAAGELLRFFQKIDANTGALVHDFTDPDWDTRFLGDLYQDLSEAARKKYALLQTPEFVEEFILDRTLNPALDEFGLDASPVLDTNGKPLTDAGFRMIDPACGSGHFLLGAFPRILDRWQRKEPGANVRELVQRTLNSIHGVDVNPFAVAIARFRLLLAAMRACGINKLADAPGFRMNLACGDSLYHGRQEQTFLDGDWSDEAHFFHTEDASELRRILHDDTYHCVVANPPYITPKDAAANKVYRELYPKTCYRQYSLAVPFMERLFQLAVRGDLTQRREGATEGDGSAALCASAPVRESSGFVGQITANSFMKREFGKKLIEAFLPTVDLTHVIDTSGAYIPGHGTPTVILFGRNRPPVASTLRTVMGIRGEPRTPDDPAQGLVWSAIVGQIDRPGSQSEFVSVADSPRDLFHKHPWSIGGGGAAELKDRLDENATSTLDDVIDDTGFVVITGEDNVLLIESEVPRRRCHFQTRPLADGEVIRDWTSETHLVTLWPNDPHGNRLKVELLSTHLNFLWPYRTSLKERKAFGIPVEKKGIPWWALREVYPSKLRTPLSIVFAFVATHNHFVLDRGGKVFNRSAPVIKLPPEATEDDHLALLGLLNSSTACFWLKMTCFEKGGGGEQWEWRYEHDGTKLNLFPIPSGSPSGRARRLDDLARRLQATTPTEILTQRHQGAKDKNDNLGASAPLRDLLSQARDHYEHLRATMIFLQEELDWECHKLYGLIEEDLTQRREDAKEDKRSSDLGTAAPWREAPLLALGQRAFEIVLARKMAAGETQTTWFERHGSTPIKAIPAEWPEAYRQLVQRRIEVIESNPNIALIEQPEYKRRWNSEPWESQTERALRDWLLARLESYLDFDGRMQGPAQGREDAKENSNSSGLRAAAPLREISLYSIARLADVARRDAEFQQVGELYRDDPAFDVQALVEDLVAAESVPLLPVLRYKPSGLRKRAAWEQTWELQRREDAGDEVGGIPVPPKYTSADFISTGGARFWALRGKLDVPKERWIGFPHCDGPDGTPVICWAGYDHLQQARAISAYYVRVQTEFGGSGDPRLIPLLACLIELLPWLKQWHNEPDAAFDGMRMGDYFEGFVNEEARQLGKTLPEIKAWTPPARTSARGRRRSGT